MDSITLPDGTLIPNLGLGTWRFGEHEERAKSEIDAIRHALDRGYRLIDTAEMYGEGGAERVVGRAIKDALTQHLLHREDLWIVSKLYPHHAGRKEAVRACEASLRRLGVDSIDLYLLHWRGPIPLAETLEAFDALTAAGKIRYWGVSNFDVADMEELLKVQAEMGIGACATNQIYYALSEPGCERDLLPLQRRHSLPTMAYCPLDQGALSHSTTLKELAADLSASPSQLALAWLLRNADVLPIPKAGCKAHIDENLAARRLQLDAEALARLDRIFPAPRKRQPLAMR